MSQDETKGSAQSETGSADSESKGQTGSASNEVVSKDAFKRLQADLFKAKEEIKNFTRISEEEKQKKLEQEGNLKELVDSYKQKFTEADNKITEYVKREKQAKLLVAVKSELNTLGLDSAKESVALKLVQEHLNGVMFDEETGVVLGADRVAKKFYEEHKDLNLWTKVEKRIDQRASSSIPAGPKKLNEMSPLEKAEFLATIKR